MAVAEAVWLCHKLTQAVAEAVWLCHKLLCHRSYGMRVYASRATRMR